MENELERNKSYTFADLQKFISQNYSQNIVLASKSEIKWTSMPTGFVLEAKYKIIDCQPFYLCPFDKLELPPKVYIIYYIEPV